MSKIKQIGGGRNKKIIKKKKVTFLKNVTLVQLLIYH